MSLSQDRVERLNLIAALLPSDQVRHRGLSAAEIQSQLDRQHQIDSRHRRTLQRDLRLLVEDGRVLALDALPGEQPRYLRIDEPVEINSGMWNYILGYLKQELDGIVSAGELSAVLNRLKLRDGGVGLDDSKICILSDSLRLQPAQINHHVFATVLRGLAEGNALQVSYRDRLGKTSKPVLHPLGVMQRGPRIYLCAMKNDDDDDRMYALDRILGAEIMPIRARQIPGFDFKRHIAAGRADFASGGEITLKAVVRGYVEQLLYDCPLHDSQQLALLDGEQAGSLLTVTMPSSGQLLRWVLAAGENITVLAPEGFRDVVVGQVQKLAVQYGAALSAPCVSET